MAFNSTSLTLKIGSRATGRIKKTVSISLMLPPPSLPYIVPLSRLFPSFFRYAWKGECIYRVCVTLLYLFPQVFFLPFSTLRATGGVSARFPHADCERLPVRFLRGFLSPLWFFSSKNRAGAEKHRDMSHCNNNANFLHAKSLFKLLFVFFFFFFFLTSMQKVAKWIYIPLSDKIFEKI